MTIIRIEHTVPSYEKWKEVFDRDPGDRKGSGVQRYRVMRAADDSNFVMIDLEFATAREATTFLEKLEDLWKGPARAIMHGARARVVELVESKDL